MASPTPAMIGFLQRAVAHEFAACRQFTLQAVVAKRLGAEALATECRKSADEELMHGRMFADALAAAGAAFGTTTEAHLPIGNTIEQLLENARATEASAVRLYGDGARACAGVPAIAALFEHIRNDELEHEQMLSRMLRERGR